MYLLGKSTGEYERDGIGLQSGLARVGFAEGLSSEVVGTNNSSLRGVPLWPPANVGNPNL